MNSLKDQCGKFYNYINNFQLHIIRCYDYMILCKKSKIKYLKKLNDISIELNNCNNGKNLNIIQENLLNNIASKIGFYNLEDALMLTMGDQLYKNNLFVPLNYKIKHIKSTKLYYYKKSKLDIICPIKLYVKHNHVQNNYLVFDGYLLPDPLNILNIISNIKIDINTLNDKFNIIKNLLIDNKLTKNMLYTIIDCPKTLSIITNFLTLDLQIKLENIINTNIVNNIKDNMIGQINNLYTSSDNNGIIKIQAMPNNLEQLTITGNLGDIMKESVIVAYNYALNNTKSNMGIHIHIPGPNYKDGSSAGLGFTITILSLLLNKKIKNNIAVTGEIDLHGNICQISGLQNKIHGAMNNNIDCVIAPYANIYDFPTNDIKIIYIDHIHEAFSYVFE